MKTGELYRRILHGGLSVMVRRYTNIQEPNMQLVGISRCRKNPFTLQKMFFVEDTYKNEEEIAEMYCMPNGEKIEVG